MSGSVVCSSFLCAFKLTRDVLSFSFVLFLSLSMRKLLDLQKAQMSVIHDSSS
jgi:hypothetical protein